MSTNAVAAGFSLTNRWLLYTSFMLAPAHFISGIQSGCPRNLAFLAFNWYTQITWYRAIKGNELQALSLVPIHFNSIYIISYLGGVSSDTFPMGLLLGLGTAGVMVLNTVTAWTSWATNLQDGYGVYQFYFYGWRILDADWRSFFLWWQIGNSIGAFICVVMAIGIGIWVAMMDDDEEVPWLSRFATTVSHLRYAAIPLGAVFMLLMAWPLILWTELIVAGNHIESATDMVAVWLFVAQAVALLVPACYCQCYYESWEHTTTTIRQISA